MTYCSLKEAYGDDFEINNVNTQPFETKTNPNRYNDNNYSTSRIGNISDINKYAHQLSQQDSITHKNSFNDVSPYGSLAANPPVLKHSNEIKAWGEVRPESYEDPSVSDENPREMLKMSLLKERPSIPTSTSEPLGYDTNSVYKMVRKNSKCNDYFHHLDTCKSCQNKLKKRVIRYFNLLQKNKNKQILPGSNGMNSNLIMDRELFYDNDSENEMVENKPIQKQITEGFSNYNKEDKNKNLLMLMVFGLVIIYTMDVMRN